MENQRLPSGISVEKIRFYPSIKEALFAVNNGEADFHLWFVPLDGTGYLALSFYESCSRNVGQ